jgi:hypothetical protein
VVTCSTQANKFHNYGGGSSRRSTLKQMYMPSSATWIRVLQVSLMLFNNPVYVFEYINQARRFFSIVGVIFQVSFTSMLLNYW